MKRAAAEREAVFVAGQRQGGCLHEGSGGRKGPRQSAREQPEERDEDQAKHRGDVGRLLGGRLDVGRRVDRNDRRELGVDFGRGKRIVGNWRGGRCK
mgnify:CR=1 FL=1